MIVLKGHSGCNITLLDSNVVRKTSPIIAYNNRLMCQMEKQINFKSDILFSPKIINTGYNKEGLFFFDMEYIKGRNMCQIIRREPMYYCEKLLSQIQTIHKNTNIKKNIKLDIEKKLKNINASEEDSSIIKNCCWDVDVGFCHGDLTFENIIVSENGIYLIDFLDSFVDSPLLDESKILQDSFCYWSFKNHDVPKRKLLKICDKFNTKRHYCMLLLHLMRIMPYSSHNTKEKVLCMMNKVKIKINQF